MCTPTAQFNPETSILPRNVIPTLETHTHNRLGTTKTLFYIVETFELCTSFVNVCTTDLRSHLLCWMLESVVTDIEVARAHPVCTGMVTLFPVSQSSTSSAVMPGCHLCIAIAPEVVSPINHHGIHCTMCTAPQQKTQHHIWWFSGMPN